MKLAHCLTPSVQTWETAKKKTLGDCFYRENGYLCVEVQGVVAHGELDAAGRGGVVGEQDPAAGPGA